MLQYTLQVHDDVTAHASGKWCYVTVHNSCASTLCTWCNYLSDKSITVQGVVVDQLCQRGEARFGRHKILKCKEVKGVSCLVLSFSVTHMTVLMALLDPVMINPALVAQGD